MERGRRGSCMPITTWKHLCWYGISRVGVRDVRWRRLDAWTRRSECERRAVFEVLGWVAL